MKSRLFLLVMVIVPTASMAWDEGDTVSKWWNRMSVEADVGVMYMNDLWPYTESEGKLYSYGTVVGREFGLEGRNCSVTLGYDLSERWTVGIGVSTRRRGLFLMDRDADGYYSSFLMIGPNWKSFVHNWDGAVLNLPITVEYHQKWFYAGCGLIVERGIPLHGCNNLLPPPYGRSGSTVMKWWHGGAMVSLGGRFQLSGHSTIKVGFEARVVVTPYAYYAEDWIGVMPSDRHYRLYANQNYGVTVGYVYHL